MTSSQLPGQVELLGPCRISGWAASATDGPATVVIWIDGRERARVLADGAREDLRESGLHPTGLCGFSFDLDASEALTSASEVAVRRLGDDAILPVEMRVPQVKVQGVVDQLTARRLSGWAYIQHDANPVDVVLRLDGVEHARVRAQSLRQDLRGLGRHPTGRCGFVIELPEGRAIDPRAEGLSVEVGGAHHAAALRFGAATGRANPRPGVAATASKPVEPEIELPRLPPSPRRDHWTIFKNALAALMVRELRNRYGAFRFGYFWAVAQPIIFVLLLDGSRSLLGRGRHDLYGVSGFYFFVLGVLPFFMFQHGYHQAMGATSGSRGLFMYRQIHPLDVILVRCFLEFILLITVIVLLIFGLWWTDVPIDVEHPLEFLSAIGLLFVFTVGLGLVADVFVTRSNEAARVFNLLERPLFFVSGVFFTVVVVPEPMRSYLMWNPILHAIDLGRGAMLHEYDSPCSWMYLTLCSTGILLLGLALYQRNLHRLTY